MGVINSTRMTGPVFTRKVVVMRAREIEF